MSPSDPPPLSLSFDDVLLLPQRSAVLPSQTDLSTPLTRDISLHLPLISAAMDTVTEDDLAIAIAREGGLGVIHRNNSIGEQVEMVTRVKRSENTVIQNPLTVTPDLTIRDLRALMARKRLSGFPVVGPEGRLLGIVTNRDIQFREDDQTPVREVMTPRERLATGQVGFGLEDAKRVLAERRVEKLPIVDAEDRLVGLMTGKDILNRSRFENASKDDNGQLRVGGAIGGGPDAADRAQALAEAHCDVLFIDAATGHTEGVLRILEKVVARCPDVPVVAGNVVTADGARDLIAAGAAAVKVGVGPGSICTTRVIAGVGSPQFTAIQETAAVCRAHDVPLIADGGIRYSGDIVKALAAGAQVAMIGSLLAGTEESPGKTIHYQGRTFKEYRGMGSLGAMMKGAADRYMQNSESGKFVPEGVEARVPYRGSVSTVVYQLMGGVRSGMGYVGARTLPELQSRARFVRITPGGLKESHAHDIHITEEPINYSLT